VPHAPPAPLESLTPPDNPLNCLMNASRLAAGSFRRAPADKLRKLRHAPASADKLQPAPTSSSQRRQASADRLQARAHRHGLVVLRPGQTTSAVTSLRASGAGAEVGAPERATRGGRRFDCGRDPRYRTRRPLLTSEEISLALPWGFDTGQSITGAVSPASAFVSAAGAVTGWTLNFNNSSNGAIAGGVNAICVTAN